MEHERITNYSTNLNIYPSVIETTCALIRYINEISSEQSDKVLNIAFSSGLTSTVMFDLWANEFVETTSWDRIHFWWVDECCVGSENSNNNYSRMYNLLLAVAPVPQENIFRIQSENNPEKEVVRYSTIAKKLLPIKNELPVFDLVILEIDTEGQLSSMFLGQEHILSSTKVYEISYNPYTGQRQIVLTGQSIINSRRVVLLATGQKKSGIVKKILISGDLHPASYILNHGSDVKLFLDRAAAAEIVVDSS